ncbi:hypothetical protein [Pseudomonas graminis]
MHRNTPLKYALGMGSFIQATGKVAENVAGVEGVAALVVKAAYNAGLNNLKTTASLCTAKIHGAV